MRIRLDNGTLSPKYQELFDEAKKFFYANKNDIFHDERNSNLRKSAGESS